MRGGEKSKPLVEKAESSGDTVATTTVSPFELLSPIHHRRLRDEERIVRMFVRHTVLLGLDHQAAEAASKIMGSLLRLGKPVNALDVLISGIAVSNNADSIVTSDKDFDKVRKVDDIDIQWI